MTSYQMTEKLFSIGDDYWIENGDGQRVFKVNGKAFRVRDTFVLEGADGRELFKVQERKLRLRDTMKVERDGDTVATIRKKIVGPLRERYAIEIEGGGELTAKGNIVDHEYEFERQGDKVAEVSKKWFPRPRYLRHRRRGGRERRADPGLRGLHRPNEPRPLKRRLPG